MLALPPVAPVTGWRDVAAAAAGPLRPLDANDYSVHPAAIGQRIEVTATCTGSRCSATGVWSPTTTGSGPSTRPSPTRPTAAAANALRRERASVVRPARRQPRSRSGR